MHLGEAAADGTNAWIPVTHVEYPDGIQGSCLHSGPVLAGMAIWESELVSLCNYTFQIHK